MLPPLTKLMSADDHLIEPADLWVDRVPAKFRDRCPRIVEIDGREAWLYEGTPYYSLMGSCRPLEGHPEAGYPPAPGSFRFDEVRPGCYDPVERLKDMDIDGVWGQLCFPNYARFAGHRFFLNVKDHEAGLVCTQTYNNYLLDEWCATDPNRLFGAAILPLNDIDLAVAELKRVIAKGARAIAFSENPTVLGLPSVHTNYWDPLWQVASDAEVLVCLHIGSSSQLITTSKDAPASIQIALIALNSMMAGADWLMGTTLDRFPTLRLILSEGGVGWVPYMLERLDKVWHDKRIDENPMLGHLATKGRRLPSQVFKEQMYVCLVDEHFALDSLDHLPIDNVLWEGDFPHGDGLWPNNRKYLDEALANVPDDVATKIAETNLRRLLKA
jgi:predicted TIM-barrel fold metal-dependent hydrolase